MWLRDSLPKDLLDQDTEHPIARILIYGQDSRLTNSSSMQNLGDLSLSFRESLLPFTGAHATKPIIFIGHSLGGLIIKQVYPTIECIDLGI